MGKKQKQIVFHTNLLNWQGARITKRDQTILQFINDFGHVELPHICKRFNLKRKRAYQVMGKLKKMGLVYHQSLLADRHGIWRVSRKGAKLTSLPSINQVLLGEYWHHLSVLKTYFYLLNEYPDAVWISERHLRHAKYKEGLGKAGHLPDAVLKYPDKDIAIEVELTKKAETRLNEILTSFITDASFHEVWYYASKKVQPLLERLTENLPMIRIYPLERLP